MATCVETSYGVVEPVTDDEAEDCGDDWAKVQEA